MMQAILLLITLILASCSGTDSGNPVVRGTDTGNPTLVAGTIRDSLGNPAPICSVWVRSQVAQPANAVLAKVRTVVDTPFVLAAFQTDTTGEIEIAGLPAGDYVMVVIAKGKSGGRLLRFSLTSKDTLNLTDSLELSTLQTLVVPLDSAWQGRVALVTELGYSVKISSDTLQVSDVPQGTYTIEGEGAPILWDVVTSGVAISTFSLLSSSSSADSSSSASSSVVSSSAVSASSSLVLSSSSVVTSSSNALTSSSGVVLSSALSSSSMGASSSSSAPSSSSLASSSSSAPDTLAITWIGSTGGTLRDPRDSVVYHVQRIGTQTWLAENLRYVTVSSTCNPSDSTANTSCSEYGRYYAFADAKSGVCPLGWHLPTTANWETMIALVGGDSTAGAALRSSSGWYMGNGTDSYGMDMQPVGIASNPAVAIDAYFWADSTQDTQAIAYHINTASSAILADSLVATEGVNVRCVR